MKITSIDIITVVVPTIPGRVHSASFGPAGWDQVPKHIIRLNTDEGIYGLGETSRGTPEGAIRQGFNQLKGRDPLKLSLQNVFRDAATHRNTVMPFRDAASVPRNCVMPSDFVGSWTREDDLIVDGIQFEKGEAIVPTKPGLGCELDEDALEKYRIN